MELKDKIAEASFQLFCRQGIRSVSMDDIAQHLGISKKTIYKWYENKDAIVVAAIGSHLERTRNSCEVIAGNAVNAMHELFNTMDMVRQMFNGIHPSVIYDLQKFHPNAWQLVEELKSTFLLCKIVNNLERGIQEGFYRADLNIEIMARLRLAEIGIIFNHDTFPPEKFNHQQVQVACLEHYMLGIATLKGHKLINKYKHVTEEE
ncbi:TetR/AcrR family transcriptional regulator [Adhaeribacter sp. BT258]|uniref:TetR/AcrR family transcriptional regulator n=1 Tax=Adhaeribacter terrigena TaxID=2793070 RepID=A0ABS1C407_9BACT|nr:TetR/AcrR family transcriptional regulator [Adhaeribacter terrigena]MBK0403353.1 TetR/AcrR family transcriptional regulator [Adhaeribacter terrigena]